MRVVLEGEGVRSARLVRFGATPALFRPVGEDRLETRVPEGAGSAPIVLVTDTGLTYTSGAPFQVLPGPINTPGRGRP
jgi:hypothetical protein